MPLLTDLPVDEDTSSACVVLGRALYVACGFEEDCRSLAFVLKVRELEPQVLSDDEFFTAVKKVTLGRLADINQAIERKVKLRKNYVEMLRDARNARNYIAHEAIGDLEHFAEAPDGIDWWRSVLTSKLEEISYGKMIVAVLISRISSEPTPMQEAIDAYPEKVNSWVFGND